MICPTCKDNEGIFDKRYGLIACSECQIKPFTKYSVTEFTTEQIKQDRKEHASDTIQPFREGQVSKEYLEKYGAARIAVTSGEIARAKNVWKEDNYYSRE